VLLQLWVRVTSGKTARFWLKKSKKNLPIQIFFYIFIHKRKICREKEYLIPALQIGVK